MELWFIYAIIAAIFIGLNNFILKVFAEKNIDSILLVLGQSMMYMILGFFHGIYIGSDFLLGGNISLFLCTGGIMVAHFLNTRIRVRVLKYLSSSEYFVSFRLLNTILLTIFGILFFREIILPTQYIGLVIGSIGILLLFEEDTKLQHSRNWTRAIFLLIFSIICGVTIQVFAKFLALNTHSLPAVLFYEGLALLFLSIIFSGKSVNTVIKTGKSSAKYWTLSILGGVIYYIASQLNLLAFEYGGSLSVVTKIIAYSLFIPIILSMFFYNEKLSLKKGIALFLTIISIYYLN